MAYGIRLEEIELTMSGSKPTNQLLKINNFAEALTGRKLSDAGFAVVNKEFKNLVPFLPTSNYYLAGGSILRHLLKKGEWTSDFDIFFAHEDTRSRAISKLKEKFEFIDSRHSDSFMMPIGPNRTVKVQLVKQIYPSVINLFDLFDITLSQFCFHSGDLYTTNQSLADLFNRTLRLHKVTNVDYTKQRIMKYISMGFTPEDQTVRWMLDNTEIIKSTTLSY